MELKFKSLPFTPEQGQVIYIESEYNEKLNKFIRNHYESLKSDFAEKGLRFCYLPLLAEETIRYNAPYVGKERLKDMVSQVPSLSKYAIGADSIEPSLVFAIDLPVTDESGNIILQCVPIRTKWYIPTTLTFLNLINEIKSIEKSQYDHYIKVDRIRKAKEALDAKKAEEERQIAQEKARKEMLRMLSAKMECRKTPTAETRPITKPTPKPVPRPYSEIEENNTADSQAHDPGVRYSIPSRPIYGENDIYELIKERERAAKERAAKRARQRKIASDNVEKNFDTESLQLIKEIKQRIQLLRNKGVNTMILHNIIDEDQKLSRIKITRDYRIFLVDYDNMEIKMTALNKAVFILFLKHPEGIRFKELSDCALELRYIYERISHITDYDKLHESVSRIADPCNNSINEKCARIREAFVSCIDERLAKNYFVTGMRGEPKRITLDRSMVIWE